jgi:hypothetical protein
MAGNNFRRVAAIGTGTIGASWTALFLARGLMPRSGHCRSADYLAKVLQVMKINASNWLSVI